MTEIVIEQHRKKIEVIVGRRAVASHITPPVSSTDNAIATYSGTTGLVLKSSLASVDASGNIATPGTVDGRDVSVDGANLDIARTDHAGTDAPNNTTAPSSRIVRAGDAVAGGTPDQAGGDLELKPGRSKGATRGFVRGFVSPQGAAGTALNTLVEFIRAGVVAGVEIASQAGVFAVSLAGNWRFVDTAVFLQGFLAAPGSTLQLNGSFIYGLRQLTMTDPITPPAIGAGNTNNYAPTGFFDCAWILQGVSAAGAVMTGLRFTDDGQMIYLQNISGTAGNVITLAHESASSDAENRFILPGNASLVIPNNGGALLRYDGAAARWRVLSH
jgi:hypothetical protein